MCELNPTDSLKYTQYAHILYIILPFVRLNTKMLTLKVQMSMTNFTKLLLILKIVQLQKAIFLIKCIENKYSICLCKT